ncbi:MAG: hypothetical protein NVS9B1_08670 [Candidatus Dormibacteraceae bacterium]
MSPAANRHSPSPGREPMSDLHERGLDALDRIAAEIEPLQDSDPEFLARLSRTIAALVGAERAGFFLLQGDLLSLAEGSHGIDRQLALRLRDIPCRPGAGQLADRIVHAGEIIMGTLDPDDESMAPYRPWLDVLGARDVIGAPWSAGHLRLGIVAAYDSCRPGGFSGDDIWVLRASATTAALAWQQRQLVRQLERRQGEETERLHAEADRMAGLEDMKRQLLNLAAHELRGPLAVISGYLSMVADASLDADGLRRIVPILLGKANQMNVLVTQMLEVARLEEGRIQLVLDEFDLGALVREVADVAGLLAPAGTSLLLGRSPDPIVVRADRSRVETIVGNLLDNAVKYSPMGGLIKCTVSRDGASAVVTVADQGLGIAAADLPRLFSRFGRILTTENSHIGGTGLGLHISLELARLHGGDITVSSTLGRGSVFSLRLPL